MMTRPRISIPSSPKVPGGDGVDRRGFLQCMAWSGTGLVWAATGGIFSSRILSQASASEQAASDFSFVQISDTHIGFKGEANKDALGTFEQALARIKALDPAPAFIIHTGDITHAQKAGAFDIVTEGLKGTKIDRAIYIPGENDVFADGGKEYLGRFGGPSGTGWQSFDYKGVHFIGLINVLNFKAGGLGNLGTDPARLAQEGRRGPRQQHAHRRVRPRAALGCLSQVGLGDGRRRASAVVSPEVRVGHGA